jgi:hypothetical protein
MMEEEPTYETEILCGRILLRIWPRGSVNEGKRTGTPGIDLCENAIWMNLEIADAELLYQEWNRIPIPFEQECARSIRAALNEYEAYWAKEDVEYA